jgi:hypothetical protein
MTALWRLKPEPLSITKRLARQPKKVEPFWAIVFQQPQDRRSSDLLIFPGVDQHGPGRLEVVSVARHDMEPVTAGRRCNQTVTCRNDSASFLGHCGQFSPNMGGFSIY